MMKICLYTCMSGLRADLRIRGCVPPLSRGRGMLCCSAPPPDPPPGLVWAASVWCPAPRTRTWGAARAAAAAGGNLEQRKIFMKNK